MVVPGGEVGLHGNARGRPGWWERGLRLEGMGRQEYLLLTRGRERRRVRELVVRWRVRRIQRLMVCLAVCEELLAGKILMGNYSLLGLSLWGMRNS